MPAFPNPTLYEIYDRDDVGTIWEAARVARVKPGTIRVWVSRNKIAPLLDNDGGEQLFHLPTVHRAAQVKPGRPAKAQAA